LSYRPRGGGRSSARKAYARVRAPCRHPCPELSGQKCGHFRAAVMPLFNAGVGWSRVPLDRIPSVETGGIQEKDLQNVRGWREAGSLEVRPAKIPRVD